MRTKVLRLVLVFALLVGLVGVVPVSAKENLDFVVVNPKLKITIGEIKQVYLKQKEGTDFKSSGNDDKGWYVVDLQGKTHRKKWSSSNTSIAVVDDKGNVTGVSAGKTTIKCKIGTLGVYKCRVTVKGNSTKTEKEKVKIPKIKDTSYFTVTKSYSYVWGDNYEEGNNTGTTILVYEIEGKKNTNLWVDLDILDKDGVIVATITSDVAIIRKGVSNFITFSIDEDISKVAEKFRFTVNHNDSAFEKYNKNNKKEIEVIKYESTDNSIKVLIEKTTSDSLSEMPKLKIMAFSEGKVCYTGDFYLSIYAKGLKKKGDRTYITDDYLRLPKITEMKFYYEY